MLSINVRMDAPEDTLQHLKLAIPKEVLGQEEIKALRPSDRESYVESILQEILALNSRGVTISQVVDSTGFTRETVSKHLERLVTTREAYKLDRGVSVFYKNGKVVHERDLKIVSADGKTYAFYQLQNEDGKFIYVQEREVDEFRSIKVKGGIIINAKDFKTFITELQKFAFEKENGHA